jgi:hypothetical protein
MVYQMKKFFILISFFLFLSFSMNTVNVMAQPKIFSQGFYTMKDLNLYEGTNHSVRNISQNDEGLLLVLDSYGIIQQVIRVKPRTEYALVPLLSGYEFIIYRNIQLVFK